MQHNPYTPGYEVLSRSGYAMDSHGSLINTPHYLITNDFPDYAAMFYSPSHHEVMTSIRYGNFDQGYDNLSQIRESLIAPIDSYIPGSSFAFEDGVGRQDSVKIPSLKARDKLMERVNMEISDEIRKAQRESGRKTGHERSSLTVRSVEVEDVLLLRRVRKMVVIESKEETI